MKTYDDISYHIFKKAFLAFLMFINLFFIRNVNSQCGHALEFEALNLSYLPSDQVAGVSNNFTMEFWVKPTKLIKTGMVETVSINNDYTGTSGQNYAIFPNWYNPPEPLDPNNWSLTGIYNIGGNAGAGVSVGTNGIAVIEHSAWYMPAILVFYTPISSSAWTHIAIVYNNKTPSLYINGFWVHTGVTSFKDFVHPSAFLGDNTGYGPFDGAIDEFRIWDVALSAGTISNWYNKPVTSNHPDYAQLYTCLKFNEGSGSIASDASGNGHDGTLVNSPSWISGWWPEGATMPTVDAGPDISTYFGIASMQQVTRTAAASGGSPPFTFNWTLSRPLLCNQVTANGDESFYGGTCTENTCPASGSPTVTASCSGSELITAILLDTAEVCVTVTDANGCTATDCFTLNASDVRCFSGNGGNQKIKMCHHTTSQNNPWVEICVDPDAINSHLAHGDFIGPCDFTKTSSPELAQDMSLRIKLFPNPASRRVKLEFESWTGLPYIIELADMTGRNLIESGGKAAIGENTVEIGLEGVSDGIYTIKLSLGGNCEVRKLMIQH